MKSIANAMTQQIQPVHNVWLMKCAPRSCWATPKIKPATRVQSSHSRANLGADSLKAK